jgi:Protein of unknown function (DUF1800)
VYDTGAIPEAERPLHFLNRIAFGPRPGEVERVRRIGAERYIHEQLYPESEVLIADSLRRKIEDYRTLHMSPLELFRRYQLPLMQVRRQDKGADKELAKSDLKDARIHQQVVMREAIEARIVRAIEGPRQLQEVMTAFWFNHFNVFRGKGLDNIWTGSFEETAIRAHTMGKFRTLLGATAKHPAMLFYLDNWLNTAPGSPGAKGKFEGINENYARELMELHTIGVNGGYTQADVIALAHILTGWGIGRENAREARRQKRRGPMERFYRGRQFGAFMPPPSPELFYFEPGRHDFSSKEFLGQTIAGAGISQGERALDILARHPSTAIFRIRQSARCAHGAYGRALSRDRWRYPRGARADVFLTGVLGLPLLSREIQNSLRICDLMRARDRRRGAQLPSAVRYDGAPRTAALRMPDA